MSTQYNLVFEGKVLDTASSRDEAERLKGMYQMDYGPEIRIVKDSEMIEDNEFDEHFESYDEDGEEEFIQDEW
jgi:hypothetical protein